MHVHSRLLACGCGAVLGLAAAWGAIVGGLLGPIGVVAWALVAALPAWIILKVLAHRSTGGTRGAGVAAFRDPSLPGGALPNPEGTG